MAEQLADDRHSQPRRRAFSYQLPADCDLEEIDAGVTAGQRRRLRAAYHESKKGLDEVLATPGAFVDSRPVGDYDLPTDVVIEATSKKKDAKEFGSDPLARARLNFGGGQRFILAVGLTYSDLPRTRFQAVSGFETDRMGERVLVDGEPNFTRVVALEEQSESLVTPMLALHTRVGGGFWGFGSTYVTLGLNGNFNDDAEAVEILAGLSASLAEERFFITVGGYYGRQTSLADDFHLGTVLPTEVTEVPTRNDRDWGLGIALSYKIQ